MTTCPVLMYFHCFDLDCSMTVKVRCPICGLLLSFRHGDTTGMLLSHLRNIHSHVALAAYIVGDDPEETPFKKASERPASPSTSFQSYEDAHSPLSSHRQSTDEEPSALSMHRQSVNGGASRSPRKLSKTPSLSQHRSRPSSQNVQTAQVEVQNLDGDEDLTTLRRDGSPPLNTSPVGNQASMDQNAKGRVPQTRKSKRPIKGTIGCECTHSEDDVDSSRASGDAKPRKRRRGKQKLYRTSVDTWWEGPERIKCNACGRCETPIVRRQGQKITRTSMGALCILGCWPICFLPCMVNKSEVVNLYCPYCDHYLGTLDKEDGNKVVRPPTPADALNGLEDLDL